MFSRFFKRNKQIATSETVTPVKQSVFVRLYQLEELAALGCIG